MSWLDHTNEIAPAQERPTKIRRKRSINQPSADPAPASRQRPDRNTGRDLSTRTRLSCNQTRERGPHTPRLRPTPQPSSCLVAACLPLNADGPTPNICPTRSCPLDRISLPAQVRSYPKSKRPNWLGRFDVAQEDVSARDDADQLPFSVNHGHPNQMFAL